MNFRAPYALLAVLIAAASPLFSKNALRSAHESDTVKWKTWSEQTRQEAIDSEKPLFFFVAHYGNSLARAMLTETFQNETIASTVNETAIPVLVDVNEEPELANFLGRLALEHFEARELPTCLWTSSKLEPLNGGGYFPPTDDWGGQGFLSLARNVSEQWQTNREEYLKSAGDRLAASATPHPQTLAELRQRTDVFSPDYLIQSETPKLSAIQLYHFAQYAETLPAEEANTLRRSIKQNIDQITKSAGFDSISGGFFTGANDPKWRLPLFQKSTPEQSYMLMTLASLHRQDPSDEYKNLISLTVEFIEHELLKSNGLAIQFLDSLAPGETLDNAEGLYYLVDSQQLGQLKPETAKAWNLKSEGNLDSDTDILGLYTGYNVPFPESPTVLSPELDTARNELKALRKSNKYPLSDKTGYTATNALIASALIAASEATENPEYLKLAKSVFEKTFAATFDSTNNKLFNSDERSKSASGQDYIYLAAAALELFAKTGIQDYRDTAESIYTTMSADTRFKDAFSVSNNRGLELASKISARDLILASPIPSHLMNLLQMDRPLQAPLELVLNSLPTLAVERPEEFRSLYLFANEQE